MAATDLLEQQAREKAGMPDTWHVWLWENIGPPGKCVVRKLTGVIAPPFASGPRKGRPNYAKKDKTTEREIYITPDEESDWKACWSKKTGLCYRCAGNGKLPWRSSRENGTEYRECSDCNGTGKADQSIEERT